MKEFKMEAYQNLVKQFGGVTEESLFMLLGKIQDIFGYVLREV